MAKDLKQIIDCIDFTSFIESFYKQLESAMHVEIVNDDFEDGQFQGLFRQIVEPDESTDENKPKASKN